MKQHKFTSIGTLTIALSLLLTACGGDSPAQTSAAGAENTPDVSDEKSTSDGLSPEMEAIVKTINAETAESAGVCGADLVWYYKDSVLVISGEGEMTNYGIFSTPWEDIDDEIGLIYIKEGVTSIGKGAFKRCSNLSRVVLPNTIEEIGSSAFSECEQLAELTVPASVKRVDQYGLWGESILFQGDAPEPMGEDAAYMNIIGTHSATVTYYGEGFEPFIEYYREDAPELTWVKG